MSSKLFLLSLLLGDEILANTGQVTAFSPYGRPGNNCSNNIFIARHQIRRPISQLITNRRHKFPSQTMSGIQSDSDTETPLNYNKMLSAVGSTTSKVVAGKFYSYEAFIFLIK